MKIDWLIVGAQVVNFLVLVWLLRRFLYRPVLEAMARRERHIAERLEQAGEREQQAQQARARYEADAAQLADQRDELLAEARRAADAERHALRERARAEVEATEERWRAELAREQAALQAELRREVGAAGLAVAAQVLAELADVELHARMAARLLARLDALDPDDRAVLLDGEEGVVLHTAWPMDDVAQEAFADALRRRAGRPVPLHWRRDESLLCGLALEGGGRRLGWDLADRVDALHERLRQRLAARPPAAEEAP